MTVSHSYMGFSTKVPGSWPGSGWFKEVAHLGEKHKYQEFTIKVPGSWPGSWLLAWLRPDVRLAGAVQADMMRGRTVATGAAQRVATAVSSGGLPFQKRGPTNGSNMVLFLIQNPGS